jgi:hypothetical protein
MNKIITIIVTALAALTLAFAAVPAYAACPAGNNVTTSTVSDGASCADDNAGQGKTLPQVIKTIVTVAMFILGALSVLMLIYGGITYSTSAGDSGKITKAKHTIMYAIVGLVVALLAYSIVGFILDNIKNSS